MFNTRASLSYFIRCIKYQPIEDGVCQFKNTAVSFRETHGFPNIIVFRKELAPSLILFQYSSSLKTWPSSDYQQLTLKLTIFSQSNRTI
jgi:hypothetical protein